MRLPFFMLAALALAGFATAGEMLVSIPLDASAVELDQVGPYTRVTYEGATPINGEGLPSMPVLPVTVALPTGTVARSMTVAEAVYTPVRGRFDVMPCGPALPFSVEHTPRPIDIDESVYGSSTPYPVETAHLDGSTPILGIPTADLDVYPVRWNPRSGTIETLTSLTVSLEIEQSDEARTILRRSAQSEQRSMDIVRAIAVNPEGVSPSGAEIVASRDLAYGEYVIVTTQDYADAMGDLAAWKTAKGVPTNVYTTTWIQTQYAVGSYDLAHQIRRFLIDCRLEGTEFVLIAGDDDKIAGRHIILSAGGENEPEAPCDIYYSDNNDSQGSYDSWDSNGNHIYGQFGVDAMTYHPDLWVGRAPIRSVADANLFNDKVFTYEHVPGALDYFETAPEEMRIGFSTGHLWYDEYHVPPIEVYGSALAYLVDNYFPTSWEIEGCHEEVPPGNSGAITSAMINAGPHHVMHSSHGSETYMYTAEGSNWGTSDIMALTNYSGTGTVAIWNSISCLIGAFDTQTCCGDAWVRSPNGGGFGAFNSRFGWGSLGVEPGTGLSNDIVKQFYVDYRVNNVYNLGAAHAVSVDEFLPPEDAYWHWCTMEYNLLGDPELPMWSTHASAMTVSHTSTISGPGNVTVTVTGTSGGLSGARVCLQKGDWQTGEVYEVATTNASGQATLAVAPTTNGDINVTVWARDYNPYQGTITVSLVGIEGQQGEVMVSSMGLPSPSPASVSASIPVTMGDAGRASLRVYDLSGRIVAELVDSEMAAGDHDLVWDLTGADGRSVPTGIYTIRFEANGYAASRNLVVVR